MSRNTEYSKLYGLRNKATGNLILFYWASSQRHKAIFANKEKANKAKSWIDKEIEVEVVEFV
jgi:hypothetical protein